MAAKSVRTCKPPTATPLATSFEIAFANELLLTRVEALVSLSVMLTRKSFATDCTNEGPLVGMSPQVGAQVVGPCESLGAQCALESSRVLLDTLAGSAVLAALVVGIRKAKGDDIVGNSRCRLSPARRRRR